MRHAEFSHPPIDCGRQQCNIPGSRDMVWFGVPDIVDDCASYLDMFIAAPESNMQRRRRKCCLERRENERMSPNYETLRMAWHWHSPISYSPWTSQEHTITTVFSGDVLRNLYKATRNFPTAKLPFHWFLQTSTNMSATR